jgi:hypothetical protein
VIAADRALVVAVCTSRLDQLAARWEANIAHLRAGEFFVLLDAPHTAHAQAIGDQIRARGGRMVCHGATRGLSAARNSVLDAHPDHRVLFIDDDIQLSRPVVDAVRAAFSSGAHVVGARLVPPTRPGRWPWFFTEGQMHLVGWHSPAGQIKTWGACMGINAAFAHRHGLRFDARLGRTGRRLESGDDTSFVAAMKAAGAREQLLPSVCVVHDVDPTRLTLRYLVRRAYWQGRSEVRRGQILAGLRKEWRRHSIPGRRGWLATGYLVASVVGIGHELLATGGTLGRSLTGRLPHRDQLREAE